MVQIGTYWVVFLFISLLWVVPLEAVALWRSARKKDVVWFIIILLTNTVGILELVYLLVTRDTPKKQASAKKRDTAFAKVTEAAHNLSGRRQAILAVLIGVLDESHRATISEKSLELAIDKIEERVLGKLTQAELLRALDNPESKGGAGLYKQTAEKIAEHVEAMLTATKK